MAASCSFTFAARAAKVAYNTFRLHQRNDPEFARQVAEAEQQAAELLHARCFKAAIEGELEPVYFQGEIVGHIKKFDSRLRIELMRAHMPAQFDTLYDEGEEEVRVVTDSAVSQTFRSESRKDRLARRATSDTVIVPAREGGFKRTFLGKNQWYAIRISPAMKDRLKYIAAYQVAPISAVTHIAEIKEIRPYEDSGKYLVEFKEPAQAIGPIGPGKLHYTFQGPTYVQRDKLLKAKTLEDVLTLWRKAEATT